MTIEVSTQSSLLKKILPWLICGLGAMFYGYEYLLRITPSVMTSDLMRDYNMNAATLGGIVAFYYYAYTPMQLAVGILFDRFGPRRLLTFACMCCSVGAYLFASPHHPALAGFARFLMGFGSAFAFVGVLKLATIWLPAERFALVSGCAAALGTMTAMFGDVGMIRMVAHIGWQSTVVISSVVGVVLTLLIWTVVRDDKGSDTYERLPHTDRLNVKQLGGELLTILRNKQMWIAGAIGCLLYIPTTAFAELWGIPYLESVHNLSSEQAGWAIFSLFLGFTIGAPFAGYISDRIKRRRLPMTLGGIAATVFMCALLYVPDLSHAAVYGILMLLGMSYSNHVIVFAIGREVSSAKVPGTAIAVTNLFVMVGGVLFQPIIGEILDFVWSGNLVNGIHIYSRMDYTIALSVLPIGMFIGTIMTFFLRETHCKVREESD